MDFLQPHLISITGVTKVRNISTLGSNLEDCSMRNNALAHDEHNLIKISPAYGMLVGVPSTKGSSLKRLKCPISLVNVPGASANFRL